MAERICQYDLGQTWASDELTHLRGQRVFFGDFDRTQIGAKPADSAATIEATIVQNSSGAALLPSEIAQWSTVTTEPGEIVKSKAGAASAAAGVVDQYIPSAGVADGKHFYLITKGPVDVIHAGNDTIVAADGLVTAASGRVDKYDGTATAASEVTSRFGRATDTPANNTAGTKFRALVDFRF